MYGHQDRTQAQDHGLSVERWERSAGPTVREAQYCVTIKKSPIAMPLMPEPSTDERRDQFTSRPHKLTCQACEGTCHGWMFALSPGHGSTGLWSFRPDPRPTLPASRTVSYPAQRPRPGYSSEKIVSTCRRVDLSRKCDTVLTQ